eukprot:jgi/Picre1/30532/NNA_005895.t1
MTDLNASAPLERRQPAALQEQGGGTAAKYADLLPSVSVGAKNGGFVWRQFPSPTSTVKTARRDDLPGGDIGSAVQLVENPVHGNDSILLSKSIGYHVPMSNPSDHLDRHDALKSTQEHDRSKKNPAAHADFYGRFLDRLQSMMDVHEKRILERRYSKGIESPKDAYRYHYDRVQSLTKRASSLLDYSSAQRIQNELNEIEENISRIRKLRLEPKAGPGFKRVVPLPKISDGDIEKFEEITRSPSSGPMLKHEKSKVSLSGNDLARQRHKSASNGKTDYPKCHFFNSFFLSKLYKDAGTYDYNSVRRWTAPGRLKAGGQSRASILDCDRIIVPVNQSNMHWVCAVIDLENERLEYYDSLKGEDSECLTYLAQYLSDEFQNKRDEKRLDILEWPKVYHKNIPQQQNGVDCGVFLVLFANYLSMAAKLNFTQGDIDDFRIKIALDFAEMERLDAWSLCVESFKIIPQIISDEARARDNFVAFHSQKWLSPGKFVLSEEHAWEKVFVPFWLFRGTFRYDYSYRVGLKDDSGKIVEWKSMPWSEGARFVANENEDAMQICGTFQYRFDFIDTLKPGKRSLAWNFAWRNVYAKEERALRALLEQKYKNTSIDCVKLRLTGINVHGERIPSKFYAMVSAVSGRVASNEHISVKKSAVLGGIGATLAMGVSTAMRSMLGYNAAAWSFFDYVFTSSGVAATCALLAQVLPETIRQNKEYELFSQFDDGFNIGSNEEHLQVLKDREIERMLKEWTRWEQGTKDPCDPEKRKLWAENLWNAHRSRLEKMRILDREREEAQKRRRADSEREMRREARWGPRKRSIDTEGMSHKRNLDYLGFYQVLGLDPSNFVTQHEIKQKFYKKVLRYHPDKHSCSESKAEAKKVFQRLIRAYEVLKHPATRKKYDAGEWNEP